MIAMIQRDQEGCSHRRPDSLRDLALTMLLFGSMGAITWAIRGTSGWGGIDGTIVPGMTWAMLWYYLCRLRGMDAGSVPLWLGLGIALGGELGYGQYVSWIRGEFQVGDGAIPIAPFVGYAWFVVAGIGWGAPGGIALGWALGGRTSLRHWALRILVPAAVAFCGWLLVQALPALFFPKHSLGLYSGDLDRHLERTVYTNTQNFVVVAWWLGALLVAVLQRDRATLAMGLLIGGGFGLGFMLSALWCLGYVYAPGFIDWWKVWELNAGFFLGVLYALALWGSIRWLEGLRRPRETPLARGARRAQTAAGVASALGVFLILTLTFLEDSPWTGLLLGLLYAVPACLLAGDAHRRGRLSLVYAVFLLLFVALRGLTMNLGGLLGFYDPDVVGQYSWPVARIVLFAPPAALLIVVTLVKMGRIVWTPRASVCLRRAHVTDLMTALAFVGAATIWPEKISVLYALFLFLGVFALNRIDDCAAPRFALE